MNRFAAIAVLGVAVLPLWAQQRPRTKHGPLLKSTQSTGSLSVEVVATAGGAPVVAGASGMPTLDLGTVSYAGARAANVEVHRRATSFVVATRFGLVVHGDPTQFQWAMLSASVSAASPYLVSLDGQRLGPTPQIVLARAAVGTVTQHRLEIEVPTSLTEKSSPPPSVIQLEVVPE